MHAASEVRGSCAAGLLLLVLAVPLGAQKGGAYAARESQQAPPPSHLVTLDLRDVPLRDALKAVAAQGGVSLVYSSSTVPLDRRVSIVARAVSAREALRALLQGTDVEVRESESGTMMLVRRVVPATPPPDERTEALGMLSGRVTDAATGAPVVKAFVMVDVDARRTLTNEQGQYRVADLPVGGHVVRVRRIGYAPAERVVVVVEGEGATENFTLVPVASRLDEVVTTVTGPQRRLEVGNVIGAINADSVVREAPITSLSDLINARVPGVQVVLNSGLTGQSPRVRIRGLNSASLTNDPLLIIDGVRAENSTGSVVAGYGQRSGRLNDINPDEIESIEIVKGPSAATLYGTDAANGVIVVKTKQGRPGPARWSVHVETGLVQSSALAPDSYYSFGRSTTTGAAQQCLLLQLAVAQCVIDSLTSFNPLNSAQTTPIRTGNQQQYGLQVSGGVSQFTYFLAGEREREVGYLSMPGIDRERVSAERGNTALPDEQLRPNGVNKTNLRANASAAIGTRADVTLAIGFVSNQVRIPSNEIFQAGYWGRGYRDANDGWSSLIGRPGELFAVRNVEDATRYTASLSSNWRSLEWLTTRATIGADFSSTFLDALQRRGEGPVGVNRNGRRLNGRTDIMLYSADLGASALLVPLERTTMRTSVGAQLNRRNLAATTAIGTNLAPGSETVTGAATLSSAEQNNESVIAGTYVEETAGFNERLFLTAAVRADGGSAFGQDFHTALYPKASVSWLVAERRTGILTSARLRAAYGASGVQPGSTAALPLVSLSGSLVNGVSTTGAVLSAIGNPGLKPERQTELETGFDAELVGRLRIEGTFYDRLSRDALVNRPLPASVGVASRQENIGSVRNRGYEVLLNFRLVEQEMIGWDVSLNGSWNRNRVEQLSATGGTRVLTRTPTGIAQGYPLYGRFDRPILGFSDVNGNGIIEPSEVQVGDSIVYLGSAIPTRQVTLATTLSLFGERVRVGAQFDHRGGFTGSRVSELNRCVAFSNCRAVNDPTAPFDEQARAVAASYKNTFAGYIGEDASFIRWRELSVTYTAPGTVARALRARSANLTLAARNIRLFTGYSGADPEVNSAPGGLEGYAENPTAPQSRYWTLRVNLGL
jgi:TonB-linked SusC/RagA family outer membrane protein